jgi:hypothetical protein
VLTGFVYRFLHASALAPALPALSLAAPKKKTRQRVPSFPLRYTWTSGCTPSWFYTEAQGWGLPGRVTSAMSTTSIVATSAPHTATTRRRAPSGAMGGVFAFVRGSSPALSFLRRPTMGVRRERGRWDEGERVWKEERMRGRGGQKDGEQTGHRVHGRSVLILSLFLFSFFEAAARAGASRGGRSSR